MEQWPPVLSLKGFSLRWEMSVIIRFSLGRDPLISPPAPAFVDCTLSQKAALLTSCILGSARHKRLVEPLRLQWWRGIFSIQKKPTGVMGRTQIRREKDDGERALLIENVKQSFPYETQECQGEIGAAPWIGLWLLKGSQGETICLIMAICIQWLLGSTGFTAVHRCWERPLETQAFALEVGLRNNAKPWSELHFPGGYVVKCISVLTAHSVSRALNCSRPS